MATHYSGHVVRFTLGTKGLASDASVLDEILSGMSSVSAYHFDPASRTLTAYFDDADVHDDIVRALALSGLYPLSSEQLAGGMGGDSRAC